jgi:hypothetical protein
MVNSKDEALLRSLLGALVVRWGSASVLQALTQLAEGAQGGGHQVQPAKRQATKIKLGAPERRSSAAYVVRLNLPERRRALLLDMATLFDRRELLPTAADVRNFVQMRSGRRVDIKQRSDAFRRLVDVALDMPEDQLERFVKGGGHGGPSRLGPLSDAIKMAGEAARAEGRYGLRAASGEPALPEKSEGGLPHSTEPATRGRQHERQAPSGSYDVPFNPEQRPKGST